jgi:hypothetical protein
MIPTPEIVMTEIDSATEALIALFAKKNELLRELFNAKTVLANKTIEIINEYNDLNLHPNGLKELGPNEAARDAQITFKLANETDTVKQHEFQLLQLDGSVRIAELKHDQARYHLRILEASARIGENA